MTKTKILVVDDESRMRKLVKDFLVRNDFTVVEAAKAEAGGYSFPSGHSQTAVGTFGCIAVTQKNKILRAICIAFMILVPFSRMYVGVHTPADVLVGSAMALVMVFAFKPLMLGNGKKNIPIVFGVLTALSIGYLLYVELYSFPADVDVHNYESAVKNGYTFLGWFDQDGNEGLSIEQQNWSLVPSKYIEFIDHDLEIDYPKEMSRIQQEMKELLQRK